VQAHEGQTPPRDNFREREKTVRCGCLQTGMGDVEPERVIERSVALCPAESRFFSMSPFLDNPGAAQ